MSLGILPSLMIVLSSLIALGCLVGAFRFLRHKRLIDDTPTSKTHGIFIGLVELKGTAECETPLTSYLAGRRCVQYKWQVEEHWSRTVHYIDAKGRPQTRHESGWTTVASDNQSVPFYLKDDTGVIRILPEGATINGITTFDETVKRDNALYYGKGPARAVPNSDHRRRFRETAIPLHAQLYVMGQARERQDIVAAEIADDKDAPVFLISTRTEKQVSAGYGRWSWFWLVLGFVVAIGGAGALSLIVGLGLQWQPLVLAALIFLMAFGLGWVWMVYNSLVNLHHQVERAWSQVDVQLKRRSDLIPRLVETVEGYRTHESEVQKLLTELRGQQAGTDLKGFTPLLRATAERYPELKASESFLRLQQALAETEQRIALARDYFNNVATFHNTRLDVIPDRFVAAMVGLRQQSLLSAADFERAPVQVELAD